MPADPDADADTTAEADATGGHPLVFLAALLTLVGSMVGYLVVLAVGGDVRLPLAVNAGAVVVLVALTAAERYTDPDSTVTSLPGALGTALLVLGAYGLVASVVVAATSPWHSRLDLALWLGGAAALAAVFGFFTFPAEVLGSDAADGETEAGGQEPPEGE